jgi:peptidoglycan/LPS O-acetylase OafA/YrhL
MQTDLFKLVFTYTIALVVVVGGGLFLFMSMGQADAESTRLAVVGFMGGALAFVFNQESAKAATRAAQSSAASGAEQALATPTPPAS